MCKLKELLRKMQVDILGILEVKTHIPVSIEDYDWLLGLGHFVRPQHYLGFGFLVKNHCLNRQTARIHVGI
jgi:hypothetical protein